MKKFSITISILILFAHYLTINTVFAQEFDWHTYIEQRSEDLNDQVVEWRRHFHANPELSNREIETANYIERFLKDLGLEVKSGIAHTGVVGVLRGARDTPVVGLRADMDALPIKEKPLVPFASTVTAEYMGETVPVSHACGHDTHMAMLMGAATILTEKKEELQGTVKFIFQPAEEGTPPGEDGGASMMVDERVLESPDVEVIFGQHIWPRKPVGQIGYRSGGMKAASDRLNITVLGRQAHGSAPWNGIDAITASAQIIIGLNTIVSRQTQLTKQAAVITVGQIRGGVRNNVLAEEVELIGTIRTLDAQMREKIHADIERTATSIAESMGARADVRISKGYPITYNDPELTANMIPTLEQITGEGNLKYIDAVTGAEDFAYYQEKIPGLYYVVGGMPPHMDPADAPDLHTPEFYIDENALIIGVRALAALAVDYMSQN